MYVNLNKLVCEEQPRGFVGCMWTLFEMVACGEFDSEGYLCSAGTRVLKADIPALLNVGKRRCIININNMIKAGWFMQVDNHIKLSSEFFKLEEE